MLILHGSRRARMLILTRFQDEAINIKIIILEMNEDKFQFGIKAPKDVRIPRRSIEPSPDIED
jgi:carbon storage regulator CsrA